MSSDASDLDFQEVQNQLQILEHIAYKEGLSDRNLAWQHELQVREKELIREKIAQPFEPDPPGVPDHERDNAPDHGSDNFEAWNEATRHREFDKTAEALALGHMRDDVRLTAKQNQDLVKFGDTEEVRSLHARETEMHARNFDEDRGRYAQEFLRAREIQQQLEARANEKNLEPGKEREL